MVQLSEFSKNVIQLILRIPSGKVASYKQIAELAGKPGASRGVSWILHSCSTKYKLPWHRVLNSQGKISFDKLSRNYKLQKKRLENEGVQFHSESQLNLTEFQWKKKPGVKKTFKKSTPQLFK